VPPLARPPAPAEPLLAPPEPADPVLLLPAELAPAVATPFSVAEPPQAATQDALDTSAMNVRARREVFAIVRWLATRMPWIARGISWSQLNLAPI
jgi:hypothetical protein